MSLSTDDYENIWLRLKDKFSKWVIAYVLVTIFLPITVITTFGLNQLIDFRVNQEVERVLSSTSLSSRITDSVSEQLDGVSFQITNTTEKIYELEERASDLETFSKGLPFEVLGNRLTIATSVGSAFIIERGICVPIGAVKFSRPFEEVPAIFITDCPTIMDDKPSNIYVAKINNIGFVLISRDTGDIARRVSWLAVGQ